jgi:hypothetical protein
MFHAKSLFPLLLLALTACAVGPDYHVPPTTPSHYQNQPASRQPQLQRWWTVFDDAALSQLVEQALQSSPDLARPRRGCGRRGVTWAWWTARCGRS